MTGLPTGTVTFLFTDIEGSTRLLEQLKHAYADVLAECRRLIRTAVQERGGQEVDTEGDAVFAAFPSAREALIAAVTAQQRILRHSWPDGVAVRVRMGLHTGEARVAEHGYVGMDVHRAARICATGHGGQILLSDTVSVLVAKNLPDGVSLRDLGEHRLKDLIHPHHLFQVVAADLPADFPPIRSLDALPNNLPRQLTSFVGREKEMTEVKRLLSTACLVTLIGSGGAGKTRLALQAATDALEEYPGGVWLAEFAPIADPALVPKTVASALSVPEQPGRDLVDTLVDALRPKSLLLVLDNCEHLLTACRDLAASLLRKCPKVRILATSREGLGVPGEILWRVPSLSLPEDIRHLPPSEELVLYDAVRLFVDRAVLVDPGFRLTSGNAQAVAQVAYRLGGIPLAIELAAARVRALPVNIIAERLNDRFRLLTRGTPTSLPRHQTLRAALDWSYKLLLEPEQILLHRLSVFAGGFTLDAAEGVCAGPGIDEGDILDLLTRLVDKSFVIFDQQDGQGRYRLLETVRQYARDRLVETGEADDAARKHRDWFLSLAEQAEPRLSGPEPRIWLERLESEHDNLRAALQWSKMEEEDEEAGARLAGALSEFWRLRGHLTEGRQWLAEALSASGNRSPSVRAKALYGAGFLAAAQSDYGRAKTAFEESLALSRKLGDEEAVARSLYRLARVAYIQDEHDRAKALCEESLTIFRVLADGRGIAGSLETLGRVAWRRGRYAHARGLCEESLAVAREAGDKSRIALALNILSLIALHEGHCEKAVTLQEESLSLYRQLGFKLVQDDISILGVGAYHQGDYQKASTLLEEALAMARELGYKRGIAIQLHFLGRVARAQSEYGQAVKMHKESLTIFQGLQEKFMILPCLEGLAAAAVSQHQLNRAACLFGAASALRETSHIPLPPVEHAAHDRDVAAVRAALSEASFEAAWDEGRAMTLEQAIEYALATQGDGA